MPQYFNYLCAKTMMAFTFEGITEQSKIHKTFT